MKVTTTQIKSLHSACLKIKKTSRNHGYQSVACKARDRAYWEASTSVKEAAEQQAKEQGTPKSYKATAARLLCGPGACKCYENGNPGMFKGDDCEQL